MSEIHNLFGQATAASQDPSTPRPLNEVKAGQVPTGREREAAEEEARRKAEEEERLKAEEEARKAEEEERLRKEKALPTRIKKGLINIFNVLTKPEE